MSLATLPKVETEAEEARASRTEVIDHCVNRAVVTFYVQQPVVVQARH